MELPAESIGITLTNTSISAITAVPSERLLILIGRSGFLSANKTGLSPKLTESNELVDA